MGLNARVSFALSATLTGAAALSFAGCSVQNGSSSTPAALTQTQQRFHQRSASGLIQHVVVIVQENRSLDMVFNGFPGANTSRTGFDSHGHMHTLQPISFATECDASHSHHQFVVEFNNGGNNGWNLARAGCQPGFSLPDGVFAYVQSSDTASYWQAASNYALADEVFQTNEGPSLPAHQFLIAGQSGGHGSDAPWALAENGGSSSSRAGTDQNAGQAMFDDEAGSDGSNDGCGGNPKVTVKQINLTTNFPGTEGNPVQACKEYQTIFDEAMNVGLTWKYYAHHAGNLWSGPDAVQHLWNNPAWRAVTPETQVLTDISNHQLANIVYVTPSAANSDHPHTFATSPYSGPAWVGSIVNAIGNDPYYWGNTTILVTWDDWGGWFDHVKADRPNPNDPYQSSFRVPLLVISPYVIAHNVDHNTRTFDSIVTYIESTFGLPSLGMADQNTDDLSSMFNYSQSPLQFMPMSSNGQAKPLK
jgi:phospholipase C